MSIAAAPFDTSKKEIVSEPSETAQPASYREIVSLTPWPALEYAFEASDGVFVRKRLIPLRQIPCLEADRSGTLLAPVFEKVLGAAAFGSELSWKVFFLRKARRTSYGWTAVFPPANGASALLSKKPPPTGFAPFAAQGAKGEGAIFFPIAK